MICPICFQMMYKIIYAQDLYTCPKSHAHINVFNNEIYYYKLNTNITIWGDNKTTTQFFNSEIITSNLFLTTKFISIPINDTPDISFFNKCLKLISFI